MFTPSLRIRFSDQSFITFQLDQNYPRTCPQLSVSAKLLTRSQNQIFVEQLRNFAESLGDCDNKILTVVEFAKEKYSSFVIEHKKEYEIVEGVSEFLVVKIDHMRNSSSYLRTLEDWTVEHGLTGVLVISKDKGIILMMEGDKYGISRFLQSWKSVNIDVDSRGRPCKEKMLQILYRKETQSFLLDRISKAAFSFLKVDRFCEHFNGYEVLGDVINSILG